MLETKENVIEDLRVDKSEGSVTISLKFNQDFSFDVKEFEIVGEAECLRVLNKGKEIYSNSLGFRL